MARQKGRKEQSEKVARDFVFSNDYTVGEVGNKLPER